MSSIGSIMNTAKMGLLTQQVAIEVTGSNVTNASSASYSKQRAVLVPASTSGVAKNDIQGGVNVETVERLYDQFIEYRIVQQSSLTNYSGTRRDALQQVEALFNESQKDGLSTVMDKFWKAWEDLSVNPSGDVERMAVVSAADNLAATFRDYAERLIDTRENVDSQIAGNVSQLNGYLSELATLNEKIRLSGAGGANVNSLLDNRSELLKKVSEIIDINYVETSDGTVDVFLANGRALVQGVTSWPLDAVYNAATAGHDVVFADDHSIVLNNDINGGKLGGLLDARDNDIEGYLQQLNTLASTLVTEVNSQHAQGFDLNGNVGGLFFNVVTEARNMAVAPGLAADTSLVAASSTVNSDGDNARAMAILKNASTMNGGLISFGSYFNSLVGQIGMDVSESTQSYDQQTAMMTTFTNQREQVSGVSIDEEMVNLIKYQMGYNAAGKLVTTTQELINTLLGLIE